MLESGLFTKKNIFYINVLTGLILFLAVLFFIRDVISISFEKKNRKQEVPVSAEVLTAEKKQLTDYSPVLRNNPFGFPGGEINPLKGAKGDRIQQSDIFLIGTVVGPKELSYGVFKDNSGLQEIFKIGEPVFGLGVLYRVGKDKVFVRKGGKIIEIPLEDVKVKEVKGQVVTGSPASSSFARKIGRGTYIVDQAKLQEMISNPGQMMTDARLKPNIVNGKEEGFALSEVKPGGIYQSLGLQDGDVLLRINEYDISNPERALQAFTALKGLERVQIDLIRSGSKMTMTYQIK